MAAPDHLTQAILPLTVVSPVLAKVSDGTPVWIEFYIDQVTGEVKGRITQPPPQS